MKFAWMLVVSACSAPPAEPPKAQAPPPLAKPPPPPTTPELAPVAPPTCVKGSTVYESQLTGDRLKLCFLEESVVECWTYNLVANTWAPHDRHPDTAKKVITPVTVAASTIIACKPDGSDCRSIPLSPPLKTDETGDAAVNSDRSLVALWIGTTIRVLDATGKQLSIIKGWPTGMSDKNAPAFFRHARFIGPALAAFIADSPVTSAIRLFDPKTGKKLGDIAAGTGMSDNAEPVDLGANQFAFVEFDASAIVVHDVTTGRLVKKYAMGADPGGFDTIMTAPDGKSLLAVAGAVMHRLELATGKVGRFPAPRCPS